MADLNTGSICPIVRSRLVHIQVLIEVCFRDKHETFSSEITLLMVVRRCSGEAGLKHWVAGSIDACDSRSSKVYLDLCRH
jgi:hypothetical protein